MGYRYLDSKIASNEFKCTTIRKINETSKQKTHTVQYSDNHINYIQININSLKNGETVKENNSTLELTYNIKKNNWIDASNICNNFASQI